MPYHEGMRAFQTLTIDFFFPYYEVIPDTAISNDTYAPATRPTSITGNYGIIGDNGQITQVTDNSSIVNETTNQFFNPATGESATISDWSYNYEDRSYTVTTETGDTVTVTYGDENITAIPRQLREQRSYFTTTFSSPRTSLASAINALCSSACVPYTLRVSAITIFTGVFPGNIENTSFI